MITVHASQETVIGFCVFFGLVAFTLASAAVVSIVCAIKLQLWCEANVASQAKPTNPAQPST